MSDKAIAGCRRNRRSKTVALAGGVASNSGLRNTMNDKCQKAGVRLVMPHADSSALDNAAMIGSWRFGHRRCAAKPRVSGFETPARLAETGIKERIRNKIRKPMQGAQYAPAAC
ncbi:MAG: hypothetical protein ACLR4A_08285 [Christensenellales bacterium]